MIADMQPLRTSDAVYGAIASDTRRKLLDALAVRERHVGELVEIAAVSQPAVSQHLKVLAEAGLVVERREGRFRFYRLDPRPLREITRWVTRCERSWSRRLEKLASVLDEMGDDT